MKTDTRRTLIALIPLGVLIGLLGWKVERKQP